MVIQSTQLGVLSSTPNDCWLIISFISQALPTKESLGNEAILFARLTTLHVSSSGTVYIIELETGCMARSGYTFNTQQRNYIHNPNDW